MHFVYFLYVYYFIMKQRKINRSIFPIKFLKNLIKYYNYFII